MEMQELIPDIKTMYLGLALKMVEVLLSWGEIDFGVVKFYSVLVSVWKISFYANFH